jgi:cytochrome P450
LKDFSMPLTSADDVAYLDIADPSFSLRSEAVLAARRDEWYARTPYGIAALRYDEVGLLLKDRRLGQGSRRWPEHNGVTGDFNDWWHRTLINLVGEDHMRQRRVLNPAFSPRVIDAMAPAFSDLANTLVDQFVHRGSCEFVTDFSQPFATRVICKLVGVGDDRWERLAEWTATMGLALGVTIKQDQKRIEESLERLTEFADEVIAERRRSPVADDTVAHLMTAQESGNLSELELREVIVNMFFGGVETTRNQLAIAMDLFIQHPEQWELLAARPELAGAAVEEVMRARPTTTWVTREALEDFTFQGLEITQGTTVHLLTSVIGSDPQTYGEEVTFDIAADRPRQFGFGGGAHHCLGHFLARRDMSEALTVLSQRLAFPRHAGPSEWLPDSGNTGPTSLPISFEARG